MKIIIIIQSRLSSRRLPGKMLMPVAGIPLYEYVYRRCLKAKGVDGVIIATSTEPSDDPLYESASKKGITVFRGELEDVLKRYVDCAGAAGADAIVRVCGDSPFVDIDLLELMAGVFSADGLEYIAPDKKSCAAGLDCEIVLLSALKKTAAESSDKADHEHVTKFIRDNPRKFKTMLVPGTVNPDEIGGLRLTVDEYSDYELASGIAAALSDKYGDDYRFASSDVFGIIKNLGMKS